MLKIFHYIKINEYQERLRKAFPGELHSDLREVLKILPLKNNKVELCDGKTHRVDNLIHENVLKLKIDHETVIIPYRLYFNEPKPEIEKELTDKQKDILNCIYLRHHNGYLREKRLKQLSSNSYIWTIPYIVQLIGEYVYELLPIIDRKVNENTIDFYSEFGINNPMYWQQTESRMISYWNAYYRKRFPKLKEYIGTEIINKIKTNAQHHL